MIALESLLGGIIMGGYFIHEKPHINKIYNDVKVGRYIVRMYECKPVKDLIEADDRLHIGAIALSRSNVKYNGGIYNINLIIQKFDLPTIFRIRNIRLGNEFIKLLRECNSEKMTINSLEIDRLLVDIAIYLKQNLEVEGSAYIVRTAWAYPQKIDEIYRLSQERRFKRVTEIMIENKICGRESIENLKKLQETIDNRIEKLKEISSYKD